MADRDPYAVVGAATRLAVERAMPGLTLPEARVLLALLTSLTSWSRLEDSVAVRQLATATGMDERAVRRAVAQLDGRGAIVRRPSPGRNASTYRLPSPDEVNPGGTDPGSQDQGSPQPGSDSTPNPGGTDPLNPGRPDHLPEKVTRTTPEDSSSRRLCGLLADSIAARGSKRPIVTTGWIRDMGLLLRIDERTEEDVARVIRWLTGAADPVAHFWAPNVRSPRKLREKWDQMREQHARSSNGNGHQPPTSDTAEALARRVMGLP